MSSRLPLAVSLCAVLSTLAFAQQPHAGQVSFEPYTLTTYDGQSHPAELGHLWVPESRRNSSGRLIQLAFVRLKSSAANPGSSIVDLAGGPGIPGIVMARVPVYFNLFEKLRQAGDSHPARPARTRHVVSEPQRLPHRRQVPKEKQRQEDLLPASA